MIDSLLPGIGVAPREPVHLMREYQEREADYLVSLAGRGEDPELPNNQSDFLRFLRSTDGTGRGPEGRAWCAAARSHAGTRVALDMMVERAYSPHRGARKLTRNIAAAGEEVGCGGWIVRPGEVPGRVLLPKGAALCRRTGPVWRGHFMTVVRHDWDVDIVRVVEGNKNNRVSRFGDRYAVIGTRELGGDEWRREIYGASALWIPEQP